MIHRRRLPLRIVSRGESGQIEHGAKVRIVMAKVRRKAIDADILCPVGPSDGDKLPTFVGQCERIFEGAKADKFCEFQAVAFRFDSTAAR